MARTNGQKVEGLKVGILTDGSDRPSHFIVCPACNNTAHVFDDRWTFNNNFDKPTFRASMLVYPHTAQARCHSFVTDGYIQYLGDCGHSMAGQTVELPDYTKWNE